MVVAFPLTDMDIYRGSTFRNLCYAWVAVLICLGSSSHASNSFLPGSAGDLMAEFDLPLLAEDGSCGYSEDFWSEYADAPFISSGSLNDTEVTGSVQWQASGYTCYNVTGDVMLSMATNQIFDEDISADLSILATVQVEAGFLSQPLVMFYTDDDDGYPLLVLGLDVGEEPKLSFLNSDGEEDEVDLDISIADGTWHTVAVSLEGDTVNVYVDCTLSDTLTIDRDAADIPYDGLTVMGRPLVGVTYLQACIQQLVIIPDPAAAESHCEDYTGCLDGVDGYNCDDSSFMFISDDTTADEISACVSGSERPWSATPTLLTLSGVLFAWSIAGSV